MRPETPEVILTEIAERIYLDACKIVCATKLADNCVDCWINLEAPLRSINGDTPEHLNLLEATDIDCHV